MDTVICVLTALLAAIPVMVFIAYNKDSKKVERFYYHHDHQKYIILQICVFVLTVSFILNTRAIVFHYLKLFLDRWMAIVSKT